MAMNYQTLMITPDAKADVSWFIAFLEKFNGVIRIKPETAQFVAEVDSCLVGGGGVCWGSGFYSLEYPDYIRDLTLSISSLECLNLLFAVRIWATAWSRAHVLIYCDNMATVCAAGSARAEDLIITGALRELWWIAATRDIQIAVRHKPVAQMLVPDMLSRAGLDKAGAEKFRNFLDSTDE